MLRHVWWVLGLVLVVSGVGIALSSHTGPSDFGWFAYSPLNGDSSGYVTASGSLTNGPTFILGRWQIIGVAGAVIGLVIFAAGMGFSLGCRRASRSAP